MEMETIYVAPVFHVGGHFGRTEDGVYQYLNGSVEKFEAMDVDFVNYGDLVKMLESIGHKKFKNIEIASEFHIYVEHEVDVPIPVEDSPTPNVEPVQVDADSSSPTSAIDDRGYDSVEDELYI
ncbi:hypothetical protein PIB30_028659 [Stylosanthes scabra]|uniref:PB1-like domain-containing protein n=1 Tax=Stylosanthes scabra TaxID=79078 RepID=A0ABU6RBE3_9FABA|nr:hypothetical protein [Stylosanthes scabra]